MTSAISSAPAEPCKRAQDLRDCTTCLIVVNIPPQDGQTALAKAALTATCDINGHCMQIRLFLRHVVCCQVLVLCAEIASDDTLDASPNTCYVCIAAMASTVTTTAHSDATPRVESVMLLLL